MVPWKILKFEVAKDVISCTLGSVVIGFFVLFCCLKNPTKKNPITTVPKKDIILVLLT